MFIMATALKAKYTNLVILTVFSLLWRLKASKITSVLEESFYVAHRSGNHPQEDV
jgi:hypothetical protein